jgi:hypothetical protein
MSGGTFLGYRDEHGNEMHCAHAKCISEVMCRKGCKSPIAKVHKSPLPDGEAVAWQKSNDGNDWAPITDCSVKNLEMLRSGGWKVRPLYASPPPVSGDVRATTIEECAKIAESSSVHFHGVNVGIGIATTIRALLHTMKP